MRKTKENIANIDNLVEKRWNRFVFIGSLVGLVLLIAISIYRNQVLDKKIKEYKALKYSIK